MTASFVKRRLKVAIQLNVQDGERPTFESTDSNVLVLEGFRVIANINEIGSMSPTAQIRIFGMSQSDMNKLTMVLYKRWAINRNALSLYAYDDAAKTWHNTYNGYIDECMPDFTGMPDVSLNITSSCLWASQVKVGELVNITEDVDVKQVATDLIGKMGFDADIQGDLNPLNKFYGFGDPVSQFKQLQRAVGFEWFTSGTTIHVTPFAQGISGDVLDVNASTGLIGYPTIDSLGVQFRHLYVPGIKNGHQVNVTSDFSPANGTYYAYSINIQLESELPDGAWFMDVGCNLIGVAVRNG